MKRKILQLYHRFTGHRWYYYKRDISWGRPTYWDKGRGGNDYLPEKLVIYRCRCGALKQRYKDLWSGHLNDRRPDQIVYSYS